MANKPGNLLVTFGKRILGFGRSSSECCAAPGAVGGQAGDVTRRPAGEAGSTMPENARETGCCAPLVAARPRKP